MTNKNFIALIAVIVTLFTLNACTSVTQDTTMEEKSPETSATEAEDETAPLTLKDKVEDFTTYTDSEFNSFITMNCPEYSDVHQKLMDGEVKEKMLGASEQYPMMAYITPNYENWTTDDLKKVNDCMDGAGQQAALKAFPDYILWGYGACSAGAAPAEDEPYYNEFQDCLNVQKELTEYLSGELECSDSKPCNGDWFCVEGKCVSAYEE